MDRQGRFLNTERLTSHGNMRGREMLLQIMESGLSGGDPYHNIFRLITLDGDIMTVGSPDFTPPGDPHEGPEVIDLNTIDRIFVFGAGKGVQHTAKAFEDLLGDRLTGGHVIDKKGGTHILERIGVTFGGHPVPDEGCVEGCKAIVEMCKDLTERDLVFTITGNGQGSLLTYPVDDISLEDLQKTVYIFQIEQGGTTVDLVPIRNHLDQIKGGKFSRFIHPAKAIHLFGHLMQSYDDLLYRPVNRWLHQLPDFQTYEDAILSLHRWNAWDKVPESVRRFLLKADPAQETLKIDEFLQMKSRLFCIMPEHIGFLPNARKKAEEFGLRTYTLYEDFEMAGAEAMHVGKVVANMAIHSLEQADPFVPPCAIFSRGEMVVTVGSKKGMGGRNQEYVLSAAMELAERGGTSIIMGSIDTDGTDGPGKQFTDDPENMDVPVLTGGIVDYSTARRAKNKNLNIFEALRDHNTSKLLHALDDGIEATQNLSTGDLTVTLILDEHEHT